jgi:selenocysteine lyase/cysteine desulfurase
VNSLASHYSRFRVGERLLLTGHSHQAWPDVGFEAQSRAWLDAAELLDEKWEKAAARASAVKAGFARLLGDAPGNIALGQNTHELVTRWLSALPFRQRSRLITTDGEFHTIRRQLDRLAEDGVEVTKIPAHPAGTLADRLAQAVDDRALAVLVSSVLFETAAIVPGLDRLVAACEAHGAEILIDAYHHLNVVPFDVSSMGLHHAFVTGGGYKYCQLGEGNCFLRVPDGCRLRPLLTGWFAEFEALEDSSRGAPTAADARGGRLQAAQVAYGAGAAAFAGATYDPTSHYRAAAVFEFHQQHGLTPPELRRISRRQVGLLRSTFEALDLPPAIATVEPMEDEQRGGFLAIRAPRAREHAQALRARGVLVDARGDMLRLGPAPYLRDDQLSDAVTALGEVLQSG